MFRLSLDGVWKFRKVGDQDWLEARVPGSVFTDLLAAGKIDDPYYRENEMKAKEIALADYEYMREFTADKSLTESDRVVLHCEGLDTLADIFINGKFLASTNNMHRIYEFDIKEMIHEGTNSIRILFNSPVRYIEEKNSENPLWGSQEAMAGYPHIRKCHSMFGWDWGPQIPDSGIWRSISIIAGRTDRIEDVYITQKHSAGTVGLDIRVRVESAALSCACSCAENGGARKSQKLKVTITAPDGTKLERFENIKEKETHIKMNIEKPELWWPNGFGGQPLYDVKVGMWEDDELLDEHKFRIGLRTIEVMREKDKWGESFGFVVNGVPIFAMGANYIPEDSLLPRRTPERTEKLIKSCAEANFNIIRVWGGGHYPEDYFYDLCDEYGILVWQDFMFACAVYELTDEFAENIRKEAIDNVKRLRHHASLALWCGNNEMETAWVNWEFPKTEKHRRHYVEMFEKILPEVVAEYDPNTFYWPSSPSSGGGFDNPNDENRGDVHYWDVWHGLKPFEDYRNHYFRFVSEFGFQSFPCLKTVETFTLPKDRNIFSYVMENHQKNGSANGKILYYLSENFKYPKDFDSLLYASQLLQAEAIKCGVEHWRSNRGRCMGAIYWQLNDCWPVASWSSIDYYGRWKALHYFAKRFFAPVLLTVSGDGLTAVLHVCNETVREFSGEVRWKLREAGSRILREGSECVTVSPLEAKTVCSLDFTGELSDLEARRRTYLEFELYRDNERISGGTLLFVKDKHFEFEDPRIKTAVEEDADHYIIRVSAEAFAKYVCLDLKGADCIFDDNYFDISAGSVRTVKVKKGEITESLSLDEFRSRLTVRSIYDIA